jgi:ABC-2 type transport system permease protein
MRHTSLGYIVSREFKAYFLSPIAYIVITLFLIITGWFFFSVFFLAGRADLRDFFSLLPLILSFAVPAITMRSFSEELRSGSSEILFTLPITSVEILLGKFLASLGFVTVMILPTIAYPISIASLGELDWGPVWGGYLGTVLLSAMFCSVGLLTSSLTKNQIVAFILGLVVCFFLVMVDKMLIFFPPFMSGFLQFLGADYHFRNVAKGILDLRDVAYFLSLSFLTLFGCHLIIQERG